MKFSLGNEFTQQLDEQSFNAFAIELFRYQSLENKVYKQYLDYLNFNKKVEHYLDIPFLPIELFKSHKVVSEPERITDETLYFTSSGTTGSERSCHYVLDENIYIHSFLEGFTSFFGNPSDYNILALLPSYSAQKHSSLIYMVDHLISMGKTGGYYLENHDDLYNQLMTLEEKGEKTILFGVSYALLDFAQKHKLSLKNCTIIETGGMKGRRKEITKEELHGTLQNAFGTKSISSEYGMTELLSQAYAIDSTRFKPVGWMKPLVRDVYDPLSVSQHGKGVLNLIDLANYNSCAFIATQDLCTIHEDGLFEIAGRMDNSQIRGCNLLVQ